MIVRELVTVLGFKVDDAELQSAERRIKNVATNLQRTGMGFFKFVTLPLSLIGGFALKSSSEIEGLHVSFETMLGSAEKADKLIRELIAFAAKTPFQLPDVEENAQMLLGMGIEADKIIPTMKALGDVAAGVKQPLSRIAVNFGQVRTQTKLTGRDLRDFAMEGVPLMAELAKMLNVSEKQIMDMTSAGEISFDMVEKAFINMTSEGGKFFNLMEKRSKTLFGLFSNLLDSFIKILIPIGDAIVETFRLKDALNFLIISVTRLTDWFTSLNSGQRKLIILLAGIAAAIGPVLIGFSALLFLITAINWASVGITAAILAIVAVFALFVEDVYTWIKGGESITGILLGPWEDWRDGLIMIFDSVSKFLDDFFDSLFIGNWNKVINKLETFTFIIKDVIKSFIADIENLFGHGVGKFIYKLLGGTLHVVENVSTALGTAYGSLMSANNATLMPGTARYSKDARERIARYAGGSTSSMLSQPVTVNMNNNVSFAPGTTEDQQAQFLQQLDNITKNRLTTEITNAINQNPEVE